MIQELRLQAGRNRSDFHSRSATNTYIDSATMKQKNKLLLSIVAWGQDRAKAVGNCKKGSDYS